MEIDKELERKIQSSPLFATESDKSSDITLLISSQSIGTGDETLGKRLMYSFLYSLTEMPPRIKSIILLNEGVKLAFMGAKTIEPLSVLLDAHVAVFVCEESIHHYGASLKLTVGRAVNMYTITNMIITAQRVITV